MEQLEEIPDGELRIAILTHSNRPSPTLVSYIEMTFRRLKELRKIEWQYKELCK